jgi:radical SAM/Cys-rich protein
MKSLLAEKHQLSKPQEQIALLASDAYGPFPSFEEKLQEAGNFPLKREELAILQLNLGKMCNQVCKHCHVDAGPDRKEIMTKETMSLILGQIKGSGITTVDLTGGAPEMNPHFRWLVEQLSELGIQVMVRCNLTIILANPKYHDLPQFFKQHKVEVVSSLPFYRADRTDRQRGNGVFDKSIKALQMLNEVGYGQSDSALKLNLVYNPAGAFLPPNQAALEADFKKALWEDFGIRFNALFAITNLPISRYLEYLVRSGNYEDYMEELITAFNPAAIAGLMCRNTLSVGWDGYVYDCDFNQMLELPLANKERKHIATLDLAAIIGADIAVGRHCFGCTAGSGSSCGGALV